MSPCESFFSSRISRKRSPIITVTLPPRPDYVRQYCNSQYDIKSFLRPWSGAGERYQRAGESRIAAIGLPPLELICAIHSITFTSTANCNTIHRAIYEILHSYELPI